jgi:chromatin segregation and condensation protein Rec8/ScpA/Scc1 (kleisin family)
VVDEALGLLLRREQQQEHDQGERDRVEALLLQGLESGPASPMTAEDWDAVEREAQQLIADRKARQSR